MFNRILLIILFFIRNDLSWHTVYINYNYPMHHTIPTFYPQLYDTKYIRLLFLIFLTKITTNVAKQKKLKY